jgi:CrcB protein
MRLMAVMVGGAAGALARWAIELAVPSVGGFPLATLLINVTGAFALGLLGVLLWERLAPTRYLRPLLGIGFLGGLYHLLDHGHGRRPAARPGTARAGGRLLAGDTAGWADGRGVGHVAGTATAAKEATWS